MNISKKTTQTLYWSVFIVPILLAVIAWLDARGGDFSNLSAFSIFPLLGIWAWLGMWGHYILGALAPKLHKDGKPEHYHAVSSYFVLFCILLHPGLLAVAQYNAGAGTPPQSFYSYTSEALAWAVMLGSVSLVTFLSFEYFNRAKHKPKIKRAWGFIGLSQALAMCAIFVHALKLGQHLQTGWFYAFWVMCGIALLPAMIMLVRNDFEKAKQVTTTK